LLLSRRTIDDHVTFIKRNIQKENYFVEMAWRSIFLFRK